MYPQFLKEELQYAKGYEKRQKSFHYNNDQYISVRELWYIWKKSEVSNGCVVFSFRNVHVHFLYCPGACIDSLEVLVENNGIMKPKV